MYLKAEPSGDISQLETVIYEDARGMRHYNPSFLHSFVSAQEIGRGFDRANPGFFEAQAELADMLERKVHLFLQVKVRERWSDDPERYRAWNLPFDA